MGPVRTFQTVSRRVIPRSSRVGGFSELAPSWENGPVVNRAAYVAVFSRVSPRYHG